ncbi:SDR family oxidoreductase [Caulobacter sp. S45]|uniref:SDR family oxidoreductase n=1 Tax=Caulobacter sp. S45 TaxID=1641861 RepID=UPI001575CC13|nr:SDR family oxidoreductase [Caulobacter sp. S45]
MNRLLIFGYGFTGAALVRRLDGWAVSATSRNPATRAKIALRGLDAVDPADPSAIRRAFAGAQALLIAAPPGERGCPGLAALSPLMAGGPSRWLGYLSTTGVYGDRAGGWVREDTLPTPASPEGECRLVAERGWSELARATASPLFIFRLPGIYGPGRSTLDRLRRGEAKRWTKPGQVFSRIHVDDLAQALSLALVRPERAGLYSLCDDEPAAPADVTAYAARLLGIPAPPEAPLDLAALSPLARRFWAESKRVSNARAKAALCWRPDYPSYRKGLEAVLAAELRADGDPDLAC